MKRALRHAAGVVTAFVALATPAGATTYSAAGPDPAAIQATIAAFQADLGLARRNVTWDDLPDSQADPHPMPSDPALSQGVWFSEPGFRQFMASATAASGRAPEFGSFNARYPAELQPYSGERLMARQDMASFELSFSIPGSRRAASVRGFGIVFSDLENPGYGRVRLFGLDGSELDTLYAEPLDKGLSFVGVTYPTASIARVHVAPGASPAMWSRDPDPDVTGDVVATDDLFYGEPQPAPSYVQFKADALRVSETFNYKLDHVIRAGNVHAHGGYSVEVIGGTATPGVDYQVSPWSAYLPPGDTGNDNLGAVYPLHDTVHEGDETAIVRVVPAGASEAGTPSIATITIADDDPAPLAPAPVPPPDSAAPRILGATARSGRWPSVRFRLAEPAAVTVHLGRLLPGRRVGRRCVRATTALRRRPPCPWPAVVPGRIVRRGRAGTNTIAIPARLAGRRLLAGRYAALIGAADAAGNASAVGVRFTLTR